MLEEAWRVLSNWEEKCKVGMKKLLAVVREEEKGKCGQGPLRQGPPQLRRDQCAFCKRAGPWKNQCLEQRNSNEQRRDQKRRVVVAHVKED